MCFELESSIEVIHATQNVYGLYGNISGSIHMHKYKNHQEK
jgi:hypothetical protein